MWDGLKTITDYIELQLCSLCLCSLQLLQTSPILCSTWTTISSTGKAWMRGSFTAFDRLRSRCCSVWSWDSAVQGSRTLSCWVVSLSLAARPAKGPPRLHSPASVARQASTCPSILKPQKDFLTGSCSSNTAGLTTLSDKNCDKLTRTHNILMNFLCLPGIRSVAGQVTWLREGPQMPPGKASTLLIITQALLSACEIAV